MSTLVKNIVRFVLFILVQVFVLHQVPPLHKFITPYLYFLFIIWLPFSMGRSALMLVAFIFGLSSTVFLNARGYMLRPVCWWPM